LKGADGFGLKAHGAPSCLDNSILKQVCRFVSRLKGDCVSPSGLTQTCRPTMIAFAFGARAPPYSPSRAGRSDRQRRSADVWPFNRGGGPETAWTPELKRGGKKKAPPWPAGPVVGGMSSKIVANELYCVASRGKTSDWSINS